ncbi:hypothetical protein CJD36_002760 [Flavipsychrobacter stenotrophus]|uniref:Uncharacterized protein n=1 Tax=Flavipsychrobacter stenotrophus TaxID=2077091 RepID=A0A2S7T0H3_9BACT|nr:hypothetical protein [Flavipsychrobacter stenotrophus]PQJ12682.1 hypothetical protein CJD36_002760 [Flavipsychrobacter stenotrophus]
MHIQYHDPYSTYWKDKYKTLPNEVGPYAENKEKSPAWMRSKGLRYGGQDGGGHFWVSKSGDIYYFDDVASGSNSDTENTNTNNAGNNYNYTPSGNNILNTNAVTSPLQPIIYWPNNSNSVDITPRANPGSGKNYENGHIASSSAATGKFGITETGGVTNYGSVPRDQVNSTTNEPMTEAGNIKPIAIADDQSSGGCDGDSYLYIVPLNDNKYDKAARQEFFDYMNDRSGGIFKFCPDNDGKVILKNKAKDWLSVEASPTVSKILAHTVCNAIEGGVGFNGASLMNHRIELKTTDFEKPLDANGAANRNWENIEKNNGCFFDDFRTGMIDVSDFRNLLNLSQHGLINGIKLSNEIIQAAIIGHVVCERSAYVWYNVWQNLNISDNNIYHQYATSAHPKGVKRERAIINEMATK